MDWSNSLKTSKFMSKIFRTYTAVHKHLAWYFMILFKNPYPIGKSSKSFKASAILCVMMIANSLYNAILLFTHGNSIMKIILYSSTMLIALLATWLNASSCIKIKQQMYDEKVREASDDYSLSYEAAKIRLAAMYPTLELDKKLYIAKQKLYA